MAGGVVSMGWGVYLGVTHTPVPGYAGGLISQVTPVGWRVGSTFDGPFPLALQGAIALAACLSYLLVSGERRWRLPAALLAALATAAIVVTQVRAGWIAAGLVVLVLVLTTRHRRRALALLGPVAVVAVGVAAVGLAGRLYEFQDVSAQTRLALWRFAAEIFVRSPIIGSGPSTFALQYQQGYDQSLQVGVVSAHSTIASVGVELGLVGLALFLGQYLLSLHVAWETWTRARGEWLAAWMLASLVAIVPFLLTEDMYLIRDVTYLFYLVLGLTVAMHALHRAGPPRGVSPAFPAGSLAAGGWPAG
jgi:O-antigen ligase